MLSSGRLRMPLLRLHASRWLAGPPAGAIYTPDVAGPMCIPLVMQSGPALLYGFSRVSPAVVPTPVNLRQ